MLKNEGTLSLVESNNTLKVSKILPGHYTLETLAKTMEGVLKNIYMGNKRRYLFTPWAACN